MTMALCTHGEYSGGIYIEVSRSLSFEGTAETANCSRTRIPNGPVSHTYFKDELGSCDSGFGNVKYTVYINNLIPQVLGRTNRWCWAVLVLSGPGW